MGLGIPTYRDDDDYGRQQSYGDAWGIGLGGTSFGGTGFVTALGRTGGALCSWLPP